jgi:hypothetical protein
VVRQDKDKFFEARHTLEGFLMSRIDLAGAV